jgi:hypothetical protein
MAASETVLPEMIDEFELRKLAHAFCRAVEWTVRHRLGHRERPVHGGPESHGFFTLLNVAR